MCGRPWRPHYHRTSPNDWKRRKTKPSLWEYADWFQVICGTCGDKFKSYGYVSYNSDEPDRDFLCWVLKRFDNEIKYFEKNGKVQEYCLYEGAKGYCPNHRKYGSYCANHYPFTDEEMEKIAITRTEYSAQLLASTGGSYTECYAKQSKKILFCINLMKINRLKFWGY